VPYITIEGGRLTAEQKQQLIERMTNVESEIMKIPSEFFMTTIKELPDENIGIGGKTINKIKEEYKKSTSSI
jgi:4-oxalocrotonate tautomerase